MNTKSLINWKLFGLLLGVGLLAVLCVMPYALILQAEVIKKIPLPLLAIVAASVFQSSVLLAVAIFFGLLLAKKVSLGMPFLEAWLDRRPIKGELRPMIISSAKWGVLAGLLIIVSDRFFSMFMEPFAVASPPRWAGFLASFYGGIVEEILLRLFFMALLVWLFSRFEKVAPWLAIGLSTLLFGLGHLPATAAIATLTPVVVARAIVLNGIGGVVFGWLYWRRGLESAMVAHFSADIVIHVVVGI